VPVHPVAQQGFDDAADYEAARPSYPAEAVRWLRQILPLDDAKRVVDLAAGTGKLTRLLAPLTRGLIAVEPVAGMRAVLRGAVPGVAMVSATAEALPLATASVDAVCVAQAFHWFDFDPATAELARVVRPGGRIALLWNARDRTVPWVDRVWAVMDRVEKHAPWRDHANWRDSAQRPLSGFTALEGRQFRHNHVLAPDDVVRRVASVSHVAVLPQHDRAAVLDEVRDILATDPATRGRDAVAIPYRVDCYWAERNVSA
jgi:SAM-dependent methyltransferase